MKEKVHTVFGTTGEYSDRTEWAVCSFFDEEKAKQKVLDATARAKEIESLRPDEYEIPDGVVNDHDKDMIMYYTGTMYYYATTDILDT